MLWHAHAQQMHSTSLQVTLHTSWSSRPAAQRWLAGALVNLIAQPAAGAVHPCTVHAAPHMLLMLDDSQSPTHQAVLA